MVELYFYDYEEIFHKHMEGTIFDMLHLHIERGSFPDARQSVWLRDPLKKGRTYQVKVHVVDPIFEVESVETFAVMLNPGYRESDMFKIATAVTREKRTNRYPDVHFFATPNLFRENSRINDFSFILNCDWEVITASEDITIDANDIDLVLPGEVNILRDYPGMRACWLILLSKFYSAARMQEHIDTIETFNYLLYETAIYADFIAVNDYAFKCIADVDMPTIQEYLEMHFDKETIPRAVSDLGWCNFKVRIPGYSSRTHYYNGQDYMFVIRWYHDHPKYKHVPLYKIICDAGAFGGRTDPTIDVYASPEVCDNGDPKYFDWILHMVRQVITDDPYPPGPDLQWIPPGYDVPANPCFKGCMFILLSKFLHNRYFLDHMNILRVMKQIIEKDN